MSDDLDKKGDLHFCDVTGTTSECDEDMRALRKYFKDNLDGKGYQYLTVVQRITSATEVDGKYEGVVLLKMDSMNEAQVILQELVNLIMDNPELLRIVLILLQFRPL